jgi:NAD(P)-dependent dehydrogenase (short-subunit alcohol dehydrogenase family)
LQTDRREKFGSPIYELVFKINRHIISKMISAGSSSSWLQLANKTAVVTGAASGIGAAVARSLYEQGCHVILADRDEEQMYQNHNTFVEQQQLQQRCSKDGTPNNNGTARIVRCDVSQEDDVRRLFQQHVVDRHDALLSSRANNNTSFCDSRSFNANHAPTPTDADAAPPQPEPVATILVNCAGITRDGWIGRMSLQQWQEVHNVNLTGTFLCCREFLNQPQLQKDSSIGNVTNNMTAASIINISSIVATQGNMGQVNYAASKGGVYSLTKALAKEVAHCNIRVNCVLPGFIDTEMTRHVPEQVRLQIQQKIPYQQKFGTTQDVANLILFLASNERSGYITGQAIECSGMIYIFIR